MAAETHVDNSISSPIKFVNSNVYEFSKFLEECRKFIIKKTKKIF